MDLENKIALFTNDEGKVITMHFKPERMDESSLTGATLIDKSEYPEKPTIEEYNIANLYLVDGKLEWKISSAPIFSVLKYKLKIELRRRDLLDQVESLLEGNEDAYTAWQDASEISFSSTSVRAIQNELNISDEELFDIFDSARRIEL